MARIKPRTLGFTIVEMIFVVTTLVVLLLAVVVAIRPRPAHEQARALAHAVGMQRWRAVQEGRAVVLRPTFGGDIVVAARGYFTCSVADGAPIVIKHREGVTVHWSSAALAFTPDGRARRCDGGGGGNATIDLVDRQGNRAAVIVAALGRVRWERR